jgi:hypothetical protein
VAASWTLSELDDVIVDFMAEMSDAVKVDSSVVCVCVFCVVLSEFVCVVWTVGVYVCMKT